ncbi:Protein BUNDLE SHEATH DEFECTIVE 2, chloroplastic [Linum grandiflorum]
MAAVVSSSMALSVQYSVTYTVQLNSSLKSKQLQEFHGGQKASTSRRRRFIRLKATAGEENQVPKRKSVICSDCDGNGAVLCSQCKGNGVNPVDFFNGQFKAGESCWLCGGKKDMLCGNCNGAGFLGGFISTGDQ